MRLLNGPQFQIQDFSDFLDCSLSISQDNFGLLWRADNLRIISDNEIAIVAKHFQGKDERVVDDCAKEIYRRIRFYARQEDSNHYQTLNTLVDDYLHTLISYNNPDLDRINDFYGRLSDKVSSFRKIVELLVQYGHRHLLLDLSRFEIPEDIAPTIYDEIVLAASIEGAALEAINSKIGDAKSSIYLLYQLLAGNEPQIGELDKIECPAEYEVTRHIPFYEYFFSTLVSNFNNCSDIETLKFTNPSNLQEFLTNAWINFRYASLNTAKTLKQGKEFKISDLYDSFAILERPNNFLMGPEITAVIFDTKKALAKISIHLNILCNSVDEFGNLNKDQLDALSKSIWWDSRVFFDDASQNSILNFPKEAASLEFSKLFDAEILRRDDTATLANDSLDLAMLAVKLGLYDDAAKFLERTALNTIGYGHRKDITFHEVFEAIQECSDSNCPQVSDWLKRVAIFTTDVFDFSEREIRHIPGWFTKLLAKHNPERLVDEFDYHLTGENWHRTHLILESFVRSSPLSTQPEHSFLKCMTTFDVMKALDERSKDNDVLRGIYEQQCQLLGGMPPPPRERYYTNEDANTECPEASTIQPTNLNDFRAALHSLSYQNREKFISDWINYWADLGHATTILITFSDYYDQSKSDYELNRCLHHIFLLSKKTEGMNAAYKWAVRNIKLNNYWNRYNSSGSEEALREYGNSYRKNWEKLLRDTMAPGSASLQRGENIVVPSTQLVTYLVSAGQIALAAEITETMVTSLEGDIAHLPLTMLYWYDEPVSIQSISFHLTLLHYKWPDRYARLLTAKQIAALLKDDSNIEFRAIYLYYLSKQPYEADIVDFLSVLLLVDRSPFTEEEITKAIQYPSIISDALLESLDLRGEDRVDLSVLYSIFSDNLTPSKAKYDKYANGVPLRFLGIIQKLEQEHNLPFEKHFLLECDKVWERKPCYIFDPYEFCGDQFYRQDRIQMSFSWRAETSIVSAFLRTLAYAMHKHSIPPEVCYSYAQKALPFGSTAVNLSPADPPYSWPVLGHLSKDDALPDQDKLERYLADFATYPNELLIHANGPILRNNTGVSVDLKVMLILLKSSEIEDPRMIFDSIDHGRNSEQGIFPLAKGTFPSSFGRWETDWLSRGYFQPTYSVGDFPVNTIKQSESSLEYFCGNISNGAWKYWVNQWYPVYHRDVGNSLGTYFSISKDFFEKFKRQTGGNYYLIAEMTCVDRRDFVHASEPIKTFATLQV